MKISMDTVAMKVSTEKRTMPKMSNSEEQKHFLNTSSFLAHVFSVRMKKSSWGLKVAVYRIYL